MMFGVCLTNTKDFLTFRASVRNKNLDTVKVISAFGFPVSWNQQTRAQILALTPNTIVRSITGDPSYMQSWKMTRDFVYPDWKRLYKEIFPWYDIKPDILIEIGNEPNLDNSIDPYIYRYYLQDCINQCREVFPLAQIITPGLQQNELEQDWFSIFSLDNEDYVPLNADYTGIHIYDHLNLELQNPRIQQTLQWGKRLGKPLFCTELGINKPKATRVERYRFFTSEIGGNAVYYHYNAARDIDPQYHEV